MVDATTATQELKRGAGWATAFGVVLVLLGIGAIGSPLATGMAIEWIVGVLLAAGGAAQMLYSFRAKSWGAGIVCAIGGVVSLAAGLLVLAHPLFGLAFMTLLLAGYFIVEGLASIVMAFNVRPARGWGVTLFSGVLSFVLGGFIWSHWPLSGAWAVGVLVGINIMFMGFSMIALGALARSVPDSEPAEAAPE